jgi:GNAT superfamily N-acetyltransferase
MSAFAIRAAKPGDAELIRTLLCELAEYERLTHKFTITLETLKRDFFSDRPLAYCDLLFEGDEPAGVATWFWNYSSFAAARALYLEDIFVRPKFRGRGYGKALLQHLAKTAIAVQAVRMEWSVLPWNTPSIDFYESLGAEQMTDWLIYRLSGAALQKLGSA